MSLFTLKNKEKKGNKKNNLSGFISAGLFPCLSGDDIIHNGAKDWVRELKNLVSATQEIFGELYLPTLYRFAEFCQAMPWDENSKPYSLLTEQLTCAMAALQLRRGLLLPQNVGSEAIAAQEPQWTFAIFSAGLLYSLPRIQEDRQIILHNQRGERMGLWNALMGTLYEPNVYYSIQWEKTSCKVSAETFKSVLATRMISSRVMRWLSQNPAVLTACWNTLTSATAENLLADILKKAKATLHQEEKEEEKGEKQNISVVKNENNENHKNNENDGKDVQAQTVQVKEIKESKENKKNPLQLLLDYLLRKNDLENHQPLCLRVSQGLFISTKALHDFETHHGNGSNKNFIDVIKEHLIDENEQVIFRFRPKMFEDRRRVEGIIVKEESLDEAWRRKSINEQFQRAIPL